MRRETLAFLSGLTFGALLFAAFLTMAAQTVKPKPKPMVIVVDCRSAWNLENGIDIVRTDGKRFRFAACEYAAQAEDNPYILPQ